ncbi:hypothetical protein ACIBFB_04790 [Nocardiopsis sp. NPDC050513]
MATATVTAASARGQVRESAKERRGTLSPVRERVDWAVLPIINPQTGI